MKTDFAVVDLGLKVDVDPYAESCVQANFAKAVEDLHCGLTKWNSV